MEESENEGRRLFGMLNRKRVLIEFLRRAQRPVAKLELVKWAFLLRYGTESNGGSAFYGFVPYHYGPYSFALAREIEELAAVGYVRENGKLWELRSPPDHKGLSSRVSRDVSRIVARHRTTRLDDLIEFVYRGYPAFTVNSRRKQLSRRRCADPSVYTAGYEGLQIDSFLNLLVQCGIERLVDVRRNPIARRFGFHKSTLNRLCGLVGIGYAHVPELGIGSDDRRALLTEADYSTLFMRYQRNTLTSQQEAVDRVARLILEKPSVLVCMEANPHFCHRSRLAAEVSERTGLPVVHLEALP